MIALGTRAVKQQVRDITVDGKCAARTGPQFFRDIGLRHQGPQYNTGRLARYSARASIRAPSRRQPVPHEVGRPGDGLDRHFRRERLQSHRLAPTLSKVQQLCQRYTGTETMPNTAAGNTVPRALFYLAITPPCDN